jgi:hypothetical protein
MCVYANVLRALGTVRDQRTAARVTHDLKLEPAVTVGALRSLRANGLADSEDRGELVTWWRTALGEYVADLLAAALSAPTAFATDRQSAETERSSR